MNKVELGDKIANEFGLPPAKCVQLVEFVFLQIMHTVVAGDDVAIVNFGQFSGQARRARTGFNPKTRQKIEIPALRVPKFKAGKLFKDELKKPKAGV